MPTVAVAVVSGTAPFELATTIEVFGTDRSALSDDWYDFKLCAAQPGQIRTKAGLLLETPYGVDDLVCADTVIVPAAGERAEGRGPPLPGVARGRAAGGARSAARDAAGGVRQRRADRVDLHPCLLPRLGWAARGSAVDHPL